MGKENSSAKRPVGKMVFFGMCSVILYVGVLTQQGFITTYFTRGALYAVLPVAGAFAFSYIHGHFAGYFWSVLGIEAKKGSAVVRPTVAERPEIRERPRPQSRLRAKL